MCYLFSLGEKTKDAQMKPEFQCRIVNNIAVAVIADIDENKVNELVVGSNNRAVYAYHLVVENNRLSVTNTRKWELPGQVNSLCCTENTWGRPLLLASQGANDYAIINHKGEIKFKSFKGETSKDDCPTEILSLRRSSFSPEGDKQHPTVTAIVTLNGRLKLQDEENKLIWEMQMDHHLFGLHCLDVTGDKQDEVVVTSWDGMTFIIDGQRNFVCFREVHSRGNL
eukprot:TRINITY_DN4401_c0_g1_i1.p1 TRINITY_DN4401_c0_g1~~TRINITY_DN4401_c0_g1_i1.p1  ORF type:complete len:225 (+),score=38.60 TRINITY_DN4401_c0_g1_i1:182-856(+)